MKALKYKTLGAKVAIYEIPCTSDNHSPLTARR